MAIFPRTSQRLMGKFVQSVLQPKPHPPKRPYTPFPKDFVDQLSSGPASKRFRPESVDRSVTQWVESISGSESYREKHCRSDSFLGHSDGKFISRRPTKSVSTMENIQDADPFAVPPTPPSTKSLSCGNSVRFDATSSAGGTGRSSAKTHVEDPNYRHNNLASNNIYMRSRWEQFPEHIASLIDHVRRDRHSPLPSVKEVWRDEGLEDLTRHGHGEGHVQAYFQNEIFPRPGGPLMRTENMLMMKHAVPKVSSDFNVSNPVPDILYGYDRIRAFPQQQAQLQSMGDEILANSGTMLYPFFVIEFKGDSPSKTGSLWVATNQCLGGSASCVNLAERLNDRLRQCKSSEILPIDSTAFSVAMNGSEARLFISWKDDELKYCLQDVESFSLQKPNDYLEFRKYVQNIIEWGKDRRLREIQDSLDKLHEERRRSSEAAKSRPVGRVGS